MPTTLDEALEILKDTGPEFSRGVHQGLSNHGPMAAEALVMMGRDEMVVPWVERYKMRLQDHPEPRKAISKENWREGLGEVSRVGDWIAFFDRELTEESWRSVLDVWVERLAPGFVAAATHGVIRTGHAIRSLTAAETLARRHELAEGLGYWAARYQRLPGAPSDAVGRFRPSEGIRHVEVLKEPIAFGLITAELGRLNHFPPFAEVINLVEVSTGGSNFLSDLTETFARVYLANAGRAGPIGLIHAVTGPSAVRLLIPCLRREVAETLLRYAWQAAAGLYATLGETADPGRVEVPEESPDDLIDRAVGTWDEHAIKFTEACLREYQLHPVPAYLAAAKDACFRLRARV